MTTPQIFDKIRRLGADLLVVNGKLKVRPPGLLPPELKRLAMERATQLKSMRPLRGEAGDLEARFQPDHRSQAPIATQLNTGLAQSAGRT